MGCTATCFSIHPQSGRTKDGRHVNAVAMFLMLVRSSAEMRAHLRPSQFNLAMLPVRQEIQVPATLVELEEARALAVHVLKSYDYGRAQKLLEGLLCRCAVQRPLF